MTAPLPPGTVVCPRCKGEGGCGVCEGQLYIPDPRIAIWNGSDPSAMLKIVPPDERKFRAWAEACDNLFIQRSGRSIIRQESHYEYWLTLPFSKVHSTGVLPHEAAAFARCIWQPPWLIGEPVECGCHDYAHVGKGCRLCSMGWLFGPVIDPRWRTSTVIDLARVIRGRHYEDSPPDNDPHRYGILADALQESGCDCPEIIEHLMQPIHVADQCWVVSALLEGK